MLLTNSLKIQHKHS